MVYTHISHVPSDPSILRCPSLVVQERDNSWFAVGRHAPRRRGSIACRAVRSREGGVRRTLVEDEVLDETARTPTSKPFSVSPHLRVLRVNRPEAPGRNKLRPSRCRTPRAEAARVHRAPGRQGT